MKSVSRIVYESVSSSMMRKSINEAYSALFEGLTPPQKTRRNLRQFLPEPPGGWDSPAVDGQGNRMFTTENSRGMSFAECLEYNIRNIFFHDGGRSNPKFEPGVARIAYTELGIWPEDLLDWRSDSKTPERAKVKALSSIVRNITESHADDYDFDLNGMTFDELSSRFGHGTSETEIINDEADGTGCRYNVTWIPDFETARKYARFTESTQVWCLTESRRMWNHYMKGNTVKMYICTRPGFEDIPGTPGENCPLDEYGLSMLGVSVNPDGSLDTCCSRWNHMHGGSDLVMDEEQLCKVLNVRKLSDVCPPYTKEELEEHARSTISKAIDFIRNKDAWDDDHYARQADGDFTFPGTHMWELVLDDKNLWVLLDDSGNPVLKYPLTDYKYFWPNALFGRYNPYCMENGDDEPDDEDYVLVYSAITRKAKYLGDDGEMDGDCDVEDVISGDSDPDIYDYERNRLIHGIALAMHVDWEGTYLFDTTALDFVPGSGDGYIDTTAGNMFAKDSQVYLVTQDKLVNYGDVLAHKYDPEYPRKSPEGRIEEWSADMFTCNTIPTVGVYIMTQENSGAFFIVNPIDGKVIRECDNVYRAVLPKHFRGEYAFSRLARRNYDNEKECVVLVYRDGRMEVITLAGTTVDKDDFYPSKRFIGNRKDN